MQNTGLKRDNIDKFYTKPEIVELCKEQIVKNLIILPNEVIIEPSAGNGAFIQLILALALSSSNKTLFYDIKPDNELIIQQDFLKLDTVDTELNNAHIIGNPPFGRQSSTAIKFINYSALFCKSISFILPKSFKKDSMKNKIAPYFHCICEIDLPKNAFLLNDKEYDVPCIFQIWIKKENKRDKSIILEPSGYAFVKKQNEPDIAFRRVGVYAGKIYNDIDKNIQSHYFIKFNTCIFTYKLFNKLQEIKFESSKNTVGPKSISKQELIKEYNELINNFIISNSTG